MTGIELGLTVPPSLGADRPPESRGVARDEVRLLVSRGAADEDRSFLDLPDLLADGDLLVVNESATLPASLPASGPWGSFLLNLATRYGDDLWLAEPRWAPGRPGPLPIRRDETYEVAGLGARPLSPYPGIPRLWFFRFDGSVSEAMGRHGAPIRYGYVPEPYPLDAYQTVFARVVGSAEMPSAARPFTPRILARLRTAGVGLARVVLHTGVSSLEAGDAAGGGVPLYPEPFAVPAATVRAIEEARAREGRVIAVGTTVVRALESAVERCRLAPVEGFTRRYVSPEQPPRSLDGLLTGFHEAKSSHLALLAAVVGAGTVRRAYRAAVERGYRWHEFGDSHLLFRSGPTAAS